MGEPSPWYLSHVLGYLYFLTDFHDKSGKISHVVVTLVMYMVLAVEAGTLTT